MPQKNCVFWLHLLKQKIVKMKLCDIVIALLLAVIIVLAITYQLGDNADLARKNCVKISLTDQQLAECVRNIK